jgi:hypothetical protein
MTARHAIGTACAVLLTLSAAAWPAGAQSKVGTTFGSFLLIEPDARVAAMGNAGSTLADGLQSVYYNPSAAGDIDRWSVVFSHVSWMADISHDYLAVGTPLGHFGSAYASLTSLGSGDMAVRTVEQPLGTGESFSVGDVAFGLGYGINITDRFSAGGQVTWVQERILHSSASTMTVSFGTLYRTSAEGLRIGASLSNFGTSTAYDGRDLRILYDQDPTRFGDNGTLPGTAVTDAFSVPVLFRVGLGQTVRWSRDAALDLVADAFHPNDNTESVSLGSELELLNTLDLRLGYQNLFLQDSEVGLTLGAGFRGKHDHFHYRFDYAWADQGRLGESHRFTLGLIF